MSEICGRPPGLGCCFLFGDDVHEFPGDHDDFDDGLSCCCFLDFCAGEGGFFDFFFGGFLGNDEALADFAVHLHGEFDFVLDEQGFVMQGPSLLGGEAGKTEAAPEFFGEVGCEGT